MNKKFAAKFKADSLNIFDSKFDIVIDDNNKNEPDYKIDNVSFLFPSINKNNIENIFNSNKDLSIENGIEYIKKESLNQRKKTIFKKKLKRNYNSLLNQIQKKQMIDLSLNKNAQNINLINTSKNSDNTRANIFENKEKKIEKELTKLELKTVDKLAEEITTINNNRDLRTYLFIQLAMLEGKKEHEEKVRKINNLFKDLDNDYINLQKCLTTIIRPTNKNTSELNKKENKIKELIEKINEVKSNIAIYENMGDLFLNIQKFKKMNI
jgi:hypothetical protein